MKGFFSLFAVLILTSTRQIWAERAAEVWNESHLMVEARICLRKLAVKIKVICEMDIIITMGGFFL